MPYNNQQITSPHCTYAILKDNSSNKLLDLRMQFILNLHPELEQHKILAIREGNKQFISKALENNRYVGFIGLLNQEIVCSAAILAEEMPPLFESNNRKIAHLINVFTKEKFRRKGFSQGLIQFIINWAKQEGFCKITLNATPQGRLLYINNGFTASEKWLELNLESI